MAQAVAKRMQWVGRLGGLASSRARRGDSAWGQRMVRRKGYAGQRRAYPGLLPAWRLNGNRASRGLEPLPLPSVDSIKAPRAKTTRVQVQRGSDTPET